MSQKLNEAQDFASNLRTKQGSTGLPDEINVDPNFIEDSQAAKIIEFSIKRRKNCLIVGPTGCGKSSLVINIGARLKERMEIFSCSGETSTDELIAKPWRKSTGETITVLGAAMQAYKEGKGLLLEEIDHANADILAALHRVMELQSKFYVVNAGEQEIVTKHKDFFIIATANTIGTGEDSFMYAGTKPLNMAFMNRFSLTIRMDYITPVEEKKILMSKTGIDSNTAEALVRVGTEARKAQKQDIDRVITMISTRDLIEWSETIVGLKLSPKEAAKYAFLNRACESDRDILEKIVENLV
jgi:cobaltochelatase CobS